MHLLSNVRTFFVISAVIHAPCFGGMEEANLLTVMLTPSQPLMAMVAALVLVTTNRSRLLLHFDRRQRGLFCGSEFVKQDAVPWNSQRQGILRCIHRG